MSWNVKVGQRVYHSHTVICILVLAFQIYFEMRGGRTYFDEGLALVCMFYVIILLLKRRLDSSDQISVFLLIVVIAIGLLSNAMSGLAYSWFSVFVDVISETKFLWTIFAFKYYITSGVYSDMSRALRPLAKWFCYLAGLFAIISQFVNLGMTANERYGIKSYNFVFPMSFQFLAVALVAIAVLSISKDKYNNRLPYAAVCVGLILATKSSPLLFSVMFIFLLIYFQKRAQLKTRTVVFMAVIVLLLGTFQIQTYLMNVNAPRYLFFYYGGKTANTYFPLGSGFATFGSDQAARNYSRLYYQYGFNSLFGMNTKDGSFLSDTFWPMAIGQFGWIGSILYILIYVRIFFSFRWMKLNSEQKALLYAGYMQYIIHAVGSAILSAPAGMIGAIALAAVMKPANEIETIE